MFALLVQAEATYRAFTRSHLDSGTSGEDWVDDTNQYLQDLDLKAIENMKTKETM